MAYADLILARSGLLAYWKCDETSGTDLIDSSGNSNTLALTGGYTLGVTGALALGTGITFNGSTGYASRSGSVLSNTPTSYTIEFWVKAAAQSAKTMVGFGNTGSTAKVDISTGSEGNPALAVYPANFRINDAGSANNSTNANSRIFFDQWTQYALTLNSTTMSFFANGVQTQSYNSGTPGTTTLNTTSIGALLGSSASRFFAGTIQHVSVSSAVISESDIKAAYYQAITDAASGGRRAHIERILAKEAGVAVPA
jgi:hypothetical protein